MLRGLHTTATQGVDRDRLVTLTCDQRRAREPCRPLLVAHRWPAVCSACMMLSRALLPASAAAAGAAGLFKDQGR